MLGFMKKDVGKTSPVTGERESEHAIEATPVVKVIEMIGTSATSFDDAVGRALGQATKSLRGISGATCPT